jgi:hypothetical protein
VIAHARGQSVEAEGGEIRQEQGGSRGGTGGDFVGEDFIPNAQRAGSSEQGIESGGHYRLL